MARLIFKCPYLKNGDGKASSHLENYVGYIATREGVEKIDPGKANLPATKKQEQMVAQLLRDFPLSKGMFEYEDYLAKPTRKNASDFITRAIEDNIDQIGKRENYLNYIAMRPNVQIMGSHGLFNDAEDTLVLSRVADSVANHPGNVWLPIFSLRREDAARLGYDDAEKWRALLSSMAPEIAKAMKIPTEQFRWYAAFHNQSNHPHVHMVCYSADAKHGFLSKAGITEIKSLVAKQIFRQELLELYEEQTTHRDDLINEARAKLQSLVDGIGSNQYQNARIDLLLNELAEQLKEVSGKKKYGYLKAPLKSLVDEIVEELAKEPSVAEAYKMWYDLKENILNTYRDDFPERIPLSQQKEFKRIKNLVIEEAVRLGAMQSVFHDTNTDQEDDGEPEPKQSIWEQVSLYRKCKQILFDETANYDEKQEAVRSLVRLYDVGYTIAAHMLGKIHRDGVAVERNEEVAIEWFRRSAEAGNDFSAYALGVLLVNNQKETEGITWLRKAADENNRYAQYRLGKLYYQGTSVQRDMAEAVRLLSASAQAGYQYAQYALGKLYLLGEDIPKDKDKAVFWFECAAKQGNANAQFFLDHIDDWNRRLIAESAIRLLHHMSNVFRQQTPVNYGWQQGKVDSKLRRKIREKKIAMGHKADDHEETTTIGPAL